MLSKYILTNLLEIQTQSTKKYHQIPRSRSGDGTCTTGCDADLFRSQILAGKEKKEFFHHPCSLKFKNYIHECQVSPPFCRPQPHFQSRRWHKVALPWHHWWKSKATIIMVFQIPSCSWITIPPNPLIFHSKDSNFPLHFPAARQRKVENKQSPGEVRRRRGSARANSKS